MVAASLKIINVPLWLDRRLPPVYTVFMIIRWTLIALALLEVACASHRVIRDRAYEDSVNAYRGGDLDTALRKFPHGEKGGFITSVEKAWLSMWVGNFDPTPLQEQVKTFDKRNFVSLSREAGYFLFQEAEEGYVPSESEVVVLHLLSAIHFFQTRQSEEGLVELRQAGYVLDHYWDDPSLRIWLGSLWAGAGHWDEAQVDFRRANALSPNRELQKLSEGYKPKEISLHFYGTAPVMHWTEGNYTPEFSPEPSEPRELAIYAPTLPWFKRHETRNNQLRDVLVKSNFMAQYLGSKALTQTERGINKTATYTIRLAAIVVGVAVVAGAIYIVSQIPGAGNGDALGYVAAGGLGVAAGIWTFGGELDRQLERDVLRGDREKQEDLKIYRMVRFMPGWIGISLAPKAEAVENQKSVIFAGPPGATRLSLINHY